MDSDIVSASVRDLLTDQVTLRVELTLGVRLTVGSSETVWVAVVEIVALSDFDKGPDMVSESVSETSLVGELLGVAVSVKDRVFDCDGSGELLGVNERV